MEIFKKIFIEEPNQTEHPTNTKNRSEQLNWISDSDSISNNIYCK